MDAGRCRETLLNSHFLLGSFSDLVIIMVEFHTCKHACCYDGEMVDGQ